MLFVLEKIEMEAYKMKKQFTISALLLAAGVLFATTAPNVFAAQVTEEKAKAIALDNAGVKETDIPYIKTEMDYEDGRQIYEVEFWTKENKKYEYEIKAEDGIILKIEYKWKQPVSAGNAQNGTGVTLDQAKESILAHTGQKAENVTYVKEKLDYEDNRQVYEVEFYTTSEKWYKYEIDVLSGSIVKWEYDAEKYAVWKEMNQSLEGVKTSALKMAGLSADNNVLWGEIEQDYEDGQLIYEGKFYYNAMEYEFEINADGVVIDWEVESIYD